MLVDTYRRRLLDLAYEQYGYVSTGDARAIGVPPVEMRKIAQRGGLVHIGHGLYRFDAIPHTGRDQFMEAVMRVGPGAHLTRDAVLAFHDLALVNPRRICVGTPRRTRRTLPPHIEVIHQRLPPEDLTEYEGIPSATVRRALLDCKGLVMRARLVDAARHAARLGLLHRVEAPGVIADLENDASR